MPYRSEVSVVVAALLAASSCAFQPGQPWGVAQFDLTTAFEPSASRLQDGALVTARGHRVEIDTLEVELESIELEIVTDGGPTAPTEAHCHGDHCHGDETDEPAGDGAIVVTQWIAHEPAPVSSKPVFEECADDCQLPAGTFSVVRLRLHGVHLVGTVVDLTEPTEFDVEIDAPITLESDVVGDVGRGASGPVVVGADFRITPELFDDVDFAALVDADGSLSFSEADKAAIAERITEHSVFDVSIERRER